MRFIVAALAFACAAATGVAVSAAPVREFSVKDLRVAQPYARATPPGARAGGVYLTIENRGGAADRLVGVSSPAAGAAEMHTMSVDGGVMRMRAVRAIDVPAGAKVELKSGGLHLMLLDLKQPLVAGDRVPLTLTFERAGALDVTVSVESMTPATAPAHTH